MSLKILNVGIPLGYDWINRPYVTAIKPRETCSAKRILACTETLESLDPGYKNSMIVVTASHPPGKTRQSWLYSQQQTFIKRLYGSKIRIHGEPWGWGTESEIESAVKIIKDVLGDSRHYDITLVIATNWAHMWRVKLLVAMHKPTRWKCVFVTAKHPFSLWSHLREIPATIITFGRWFLSKDNI